MCIMYSVYGTVYKHETHVIDQGYPCYPCSIVHGTRPDCMQVFFECDFKKINALSLSLWLSVCLTVCLSVSLSFAPSHSCTLTLSLSLTCLLPYIHILRRDAWIYRLSIRKTPSTIINNREPS